MIHQGRQPTCSLNWCDGSITQGFADDAMKRFVAMIGGHPFIQCNEFGGTAAGPQIIDHAIFEFDSHEHGDVVISPMLTVRIFLRP